MKLFTKNGIRTSIVDGDLIKFIKSSNDENTVGIEVLRYVGGKSGITEKISDRKSPLVNVESLFLSQDCENTVYGINLTSATPANLRKLARLMTSASSDLGIGSQVVIEDDYIIVFMVVAE